MMIYLIITLAVLVVFLVILISLLVSLRQEKMRVKAGTVILNGGKSVNTEIIRENMGKGILNEHTGECITTVVNISQKLAAKRHWMRLTDRESGEVYQMAFVSEIVLGSIPERNRIKLVIAKEGISRVHCRIYWRDGKYVVEDCQSTNHTWLNGFKLEKPFLIDTGDILGLGQKEFGVEIWAEV